MTRAGCECSFEQAPKVLVLIPCYNEQDNIVQVVERLRATCPWTDYLVINDCSTDHSADLLRSHGYNFLDLPVNLGIGGGIQCGYLYSVRHGYDITIQMDGDGQHDPAYLSTVVEPVASGKLDMCIGSRFITHEGFQTSFMRRVGIHLLSGMIRVLCGRKVQDVTSGFRATSAEMTAFLPGIMPPIIPSRKLSWPPAWQGSGWARPRWSCTSVWAVCPAFRHSRASTICSRYRCL